MLRLGDRRIQVIKRALRMSESAFSHALRRLEEKGLVEALQYGREKEARLTSTGRIVYSSLQALCYTLGGNDGTNVEDDTSLVRCLREDQQAGLED